ncbi:MAG: hypothetical protein ATN31_05370 [Candidatus Epulonipiscioides saccharophilum]|nr:MAG: hypothetical protein ATN31_05370 [Epulopiscium sp. AS2M-Bin001]
MRCDLEQLSLYVDEEMDLPQKLEIEKHLKTCTNCQNDLKMMLEIKEQLANFTMLNEIELPNNFHDALMQKIHLQTINSQTIHKDKSITNIKDQKNIKHILYNKYYLSAASIFIIGIVGVSVYFNQDPNKTHMTPVAIPDMFTYKHTDDYPINPSEQIITRSIQESPPVAPMDNFMNYSIEANATNREVIEKFKKQMQEKNLEYWDNSIENKLHYTIESEKDYLIIKEYFEENPQDTNEQLIFSEWPENELFDLIIYYP